MKLILATALVLVFASASVAANIPSLIDDASVVQSLSPPLRDSEVRYLRVSGRFLAIVYETSDSSVAAVYDDAGNCTFRHAELINEASKIWKLDVSGNGRSIIVGQAAAPEGSYYTVYSATGQKLFDKLSTAGLQTSPDGRRFCLQFTALYNGPLSVFDTSGQEIIKDIRLRSAWNAKFLGNDALFVTEVDSCRLVDLNTGRFSWSIATGLKQPGLTPLVRYSASDSAFLVFDTKTVSCIGAEGVLRWTSDFGAEFVSDVAVDPNTDRALIRVCRANYLSGYLVETSTREWQVISTSRDYAELSGTAQRGFPTMWFRSGLVFVWTPQSQGLARLSSEIPYETLLIDLSIPGSHKELVTNGLIVPTTSRNGEMRYAKVNPPSTVNIMKSDVSPR